MASDFWADLDQPRKHPVKYEGAAPKSDFWADLDQPAEEPSTFQKKAVEETAPPVAERFKAAARYFTPFPGAVSAITEPESPEGQAARHDLGALLQPLPRAATDIFAAAQTGATKLGLGKEFEAGMAMFPFMTRGAPIRPGLALEMLRRPGAEPTMAPAPEIMGPPRPPVPDIGKMSTAEWLKTPAGQKAAAEVEAESQRIFPQQPQVSSPPTAPAAVETPVPPRTPAAALPPHPLDDFAFQMQARTMAPMAAPEAPKVAAPTVKKTRAKPVREEPAPPAAKATPTVAERLAAAQAENQKLRTALQPEEPAPPAPAAERPQPVTAKPSPVPAAAPKVTEGTKWQWPIEELYEENKGLAKLRGKEPPSLEEYRAVMENPRLDPQATPTDVMSNMVEGRAQTLMVGPRRATLDTPESREAHAKVAESSAQIVAKMAEETKGMTPEQKTAWLDDQLIKAASERVDAERAAAGEAQRTELQRGSITVPQARNIGSWLDRTLNAKELTKDIIREKTGERTASMAQAEEALKTERKRWANAPTQDSLTLIDKVETGNIAALPAQDQPLANTFRRILDQDRTDIQALGPGKLEHWIENYFPHIWEQPGGLARLTARIMGKRPLEGPASGLKKRTIPTTKEGMSWRVYNQEGDFLAAFPDQITADARAGMIPGGTVRPPLKPVSNNPIDLMLLRHGESQKYIAAHKIKDEMVDRGTAKFVRFGQKPPEGWRQLDDKIFRVLQYSSEEKGFVIRGQYYAPEGAATVFNNFLSPGLKGNWAFDAARASGNVMNQAQLGLSFFHAGFTTLETGVSDLALAIQKFSRGDISGGARAAVYSISGHTWLNNPLIGHKVLRNYLEPGSYPQYDRAVGLLKSAGGRPFQSEHFTNQAVRALEKGWQDKDALLMARKLFPAALEYASKPTMEWLVPRQKMGAFAKLAQDIIERGDREGWSQDKIRHEAGKAWDTIDNRLGQMTYDTLMVNKVIKDLAFVGVRSVGWNLGSVREFGGGLAIDLPRELLRAATGKGFEVTPRMAYSLALPIYAGWAGFVTTVALTGELPKTITDFFYPPTGVKDESGKPERLNLPTYMKDIIGARTHPVQMVTHKLHPLLASTAQMLENKDFYGTQIRDPQDPAYQQILKSAEFIAKQFLPFSIRAAMQRAVTSGEATGTDIGSQFIGAFQPASLPATALSMIGIQPAPRSATGSPAERLVSEYSQMRLPHEVSQVQRQRSLEARQLLQRVKTGKAQPNEVQQAIRAGKLTQEHFDRMRANEQLPYLVRGIKGFQLHEALNVWKVSDDKERMQIKNTILNKGHLLENYPIENRQQMFQQLQQIKNWYPGKRAVNQ